MDSELIKYLFVPLTVLLTATLLVYVIRKSVTVFIHNRSHLLKVDPTNYSFLKHSISFIIYIVAIIVIVYTIPELKDLGAGLLTGAGVVAAILAFASQAAFSNIVSGIFIVIFRPFRVGDQIEIEGEGYSGNVEDITLRHTVIRDFQNKRIIIPNSIISNKTIVNSHINDERIVRHIHIDISYESDVDKAMDILRILCERHPHCIDVRSNEEIDEGMPKVLVKVRHLSEYAITLRAWVWSENPALSFELFTDILYQVKKEYDRAGIEIPYPHRTIVFKKDIEGTGDVRETP